MTSTSVIIRGYNRAAQIGKAIESAQDQDFEGPIELIVVDDGSTDSTGKVVGAYPGVRYIRQENQGVAGARETGRIHAKGEFLAYLDSDDTWDPGYLSALVPRLIQTGADFSFAEWRYGDVSDASPPLPPLTRYDPWLDSGWKPLRDGLYLLPNPVARSLFLRHHRAVTSGTILRRSALTPELNTRVRVSDDWVAVLDILLSRRGSSGIYCEKVLWTKHTDGSNIYDRSADSARVVNDELGDLEWIRAQFDECLSRPERRLLKRRQAQLHLDRAYISKNRRSPSYSPTQDCLKSLRLGPSWKGFWTLAKMALLRGLSVKQKG